MKEDKRKNNGGHKNGGRKSKAEEQNLIEKLSPMESEALKVFKKAITEEKPWAVKMYFEYMYGKPVETKDIKIQGEQPLFPID